MSHASSKIWDTVIVGAGAAGLIAAITARRLGLEVLLVEGAKNTGSKILISGGGRCNLTNQEVGDQDYPTEEKVVLRSVLKAFSSDAAIRFFKDIGVETLMEKDGKIFPKSHSGRTVLEALIKEIEKLGICFEYSKKVAHIIPEKGCFQLLGDGFAYSAKTVLLATGGLSYPQTGSDGSGYELVKSLGHMIIPTSPALVPLLTNDPDWKNLAGVSLPVKISFWEGGKKTVSSEGDFLFTHIGFSGPAVLDISRHWIRANKESGPKLTCNVLPTEKEDDFRAKLLAAASQKRSRSIKSYLGGILPARFVEVMLRKLGIAQNIAINQMKKAEREMLVRSLFYLELPVAGSLGYEKAEVTAGGVSLGEVDKSTLESKVRHGLFFAGEILDVDGRIGGFNFQWAWSSGVVAARGIVKRISAHK